MTALTWSKTPPQVAGFYFMRRMEDGKPEIDVAEVHAAGADWERYHEGGKTLWWFGAIYHGGPVSTLTGVEWSGPIPPPEDGPSEAGS